MGMRMGSAAGGSMAGYPAGGSFAGGSFAGGSVAGWGMPTMSSGPDIRGVGISFDQVLTTFLSLSFSLCPSSHCLPLFVSLHFEPDNSAPCLLGEMSFCALPCILHPKQGPDMNGLMRVYVRRIRPDGSAAQVCVAHTRVRDVSTSGNHFKSQ